MATKVKGASRDRELASIKRRLPYLTDYGLQQALEPTEYFVDYDDREEVEQAAAQDEDEYEPPARHSLDARSLAQARRIARALLAEWEGASPSIYRRTHVEPLNDTHNGLLIPSWSVIEDEFVEEVY